MKSAYRVQYTNKETGKVSYANTPTNYSYTCFENRESAQHLMNQIFHERPLAKERNIFKIVYENVDDDERILKSY